MRYTSKLYKEVAWRKTLAGRFYEKLINSKTIMGSAYRKTFHAPIYNLLKKEGAYLRKAKGFILDIGGNIGSFDKKTMKGLKRQKYFRIDIDAEAKPNIVGDAHMLPLKDQSVDMIICKSLLEHLKEPWTAVREMHRVLKKNGKLYFFVPFMNRIHAAPNDYYRFTKQGMKYLLRDFKKTEINTSGGFFSTMFNLIFLLTYWLDTFLLLGFLMRIVMWPFAWIIVQLDVLDKYKLAATFYYGLAVK
jgi:SAM-dependent methyltransferase